VRNSPLNGGAIPVSPVLALLGMGPSRKAACVLALIVVLVDAKEDLGKAGMPLAWTRAPAESQPIAERVVDGLLIGLKHIIA